MTLQCLLNERYDDFARTIEADLRPVGIMENLAVAQVVAAQARLMRCDSILESEHPDIDKLRHRAALMQRRFMGELRQLQADRFLKARLNLDCPGALPVREAHKVLGNRLFETSADPGSSTPPAATPETPPRETANAKNAKTKPISDPKPSVAPVHPQAVAQAEAAILAILEAEHPPGPQNSHKRSQFASPRPLDQLPPAPGQPNDTRPTPQKGAGSVRAPIKLAS